MASKQIRAKRAKVQMFTKTEMEQKVVISNLYVSRRWDDNDLEFSVTSCTSPS